jgi:hypothetical protein
MKDRPRFKESHKEFEPTFLVNTFLTDEYARQDNEKLMN